MPASDETRAAQRAALDRVDALERAKAVLYAQEARTRLLIGELWGRDPGQFLELAGAARIGQNRASGQLDRAERLVRHFPVALGLLEHGVMFVGCAEMLLWLSKNCSPQVQQLLDARLSETVCLMDAADARRRITLAIPELEAEVDAAAQRERLERAHANRRVWVDPVQDGMARIGAELDAVDARRWALDFDELVRAQKLVDERDGVVRTQDQRRADLFAEMPSRLLGLADAAAKGRLQQLLTDTADPLGRLLALPVRKPTVLNVHTGMATQLDMDQRSSWVEGLGAIPAVRARVLLPSAGLRRIGVDERTGIPLGMDPPQMPKAPWGHAVDFSPADAKQQQERLLALLTPMYVTECAEPQHDPSTDLRRLLQIRDLTCDGPGCPRAATACELDHEIPWAEGGQTASWNLRHRSTRCHHLRHDDWTVARDEITGVSRWLSPAGSELERLSAWLPPTELPEDAELPEPRLERPFHITPEAYELADELPLWPTLPPVAPPEPRFTRRGISTEDTDTLDDNVQPTQPTKIDGQWETDPPPF